MKLIGVVTGEFQGNKWAKVVLTEPMPVRAGAVGLNSIVSKAHYDYICNEILPCFDLFANQEVRVFYDRFGKIQEIVLASD